MAVSVRELFLIVRAQNQAHNTLASVSRDLRGLSESARLAEERSKLADKAMQLQNTRNAVRGNLGQEISNARNIDAQRKTAADNYNQALAARNNILKDQMAAEDELGRAQQTRERYVRHLNQATMQYNLASRGGLMKEADKAAASMQRYNSLIGNQDMRISRLQSNITGLGTAWKHANKFAGEQVTVQEKLGRAYDKARTRVKSLFGQYQNLGIQLDDTNGQLSKVDKSLSRAKAGFSREGFVQATHAIGGMGRMMQYTGGIATAALGFMANSAAELDRTTTLAATQVGNNVQQVRKQSVANFNAIIGQMAKFPSAADDMSAALYDIFSTLNVNGKQGRAILVQLNKAAVAGGISTQQAGQGVLSVLSNFKEFAQTGSGVEKVLNRSFAAVRFGRITMDEFQKSLQTTAPAANQTGQTFNNLAGSVAFLTRSLGASKASVGYARLLQQLTSTKMVEGLKKHGISVRDAAGHYKQLDVIMGEIARKFPQLTRGQESAQNFFKDMSNTTGTIQGARAFTSIIRNMSGYRDILHKTTNDNNEFGKSFTTMSQSLGVQWQTFLNSVKAAGVSIGAYVIPVFAELGKSIQRLVQWFNSLDEGQKKTIGKWLAYGAIGTTLVGVFLSVTAAVAGFIAILGAAEIGFAAFGTASLVFVGVAAAGLLIYKNWDTVGPVIMAVVNAVQSLIEAMGGLNGVLITSIGIFAGVFYAAKTLTEGLIALELISGGGIVLAAVVGVAALAAGLYALNRLFGGTRSGFQNMVHASEQFNTHMQDVAKNTRDAADAQYQFRTAGFALRDARDAVSKYRRELDKATPGTKAYRDAQQNLAEAQTNVAKATQDAADAQDSLNMSLGKAADSSKQVLNDLTSSVKQYGDAAKVAAATHATMTGAPGAAPMPGGLYAGAGIARANKEANDAMAKTRENLQKGIAQLPEFQAQYKRLLDLGLSPANEKMTEIRHNMTLMIAEAAGLSPKATAGFMKLNDTLGRIAEPREIKYVSNIDKDVLPGVREFMKTTHEIPSTKAIKFLSNHKQIQQGAATLMGVLGRIPKEKELKFLSNIPDYAIPAVDNLIRKVHGIPTQKQIDVAVTGAKKIDDARKKVKRLRDEQMRAAHVAHATGTYLSAPKTQKFDAMIQKAQHQLDKLQHKRTTSTIFLKSKPSDPGTWATQLGASVKDGVMAGASGLEAQLQTYLENAIHNAIQNAKTSTKGANASSPSKKSAKLIGEPIIQGVIKGIKDGQSGLNDAMNTAVDTMLSIIQDNKSTFTDQMGQIFSGQRIQDKIDWGETINFKDLQADLKTQVKSFEKFQHGVQKLAKRHVPFEMRKEIQALGPEAQGQLTALLHATPRQLRQYVKLWERSQKDINKTAVRGAKDQVKAWKRQGAAAALGFMSGMQSYQPALTRFFRRIFLGLVNQVKAHHKSKSPSKVYMLEGQNVMRGFILGIEREAYNFNRAKKNLDPKFSLASSNAPVGGARAGRAAGTTQHHEHTHYHIPAKEKDKDLIKALRKEDYHRRNRRR